MKDWKIKRIKSLLKKNKERPIIFIHTPKCAGSYVSLLVEYNKSSVFYVSKHRMIKYARSKGLRGPSFTVIREPAERFASLLNYYFEFFTKPQQKWPADIIKAHSNKSLTLDDFIEGLSDQRLLLLKKKLFNIAYKNLSTYSKGVDILITIEELPHFLKLCGNDYEKMKIPTPKSKGLTAKRKIYGTKVSTKKRGILSEKNKQRIRKLYKEDVKLWKKWTS